MQDTGIPKEIADSSAFDAKLAFRCSLCRLCEAVCPKELKISDMFLEFRRLVVREDSDILKHFKPLLTYESFGASKYAKIYKLPKGCDTVLFPGCEFPHTRATSLKKLYSILQKVIPDIGIAMDCCLKPSFDLGREEFFHQKISAIRERFAKYGIKNIITLCPSCYVTLKGNLPGMSVTMIYDKLMDTDFNRRTDKEYHLIDPCKLRFEDDILLSVRKIAKKNGVQLKELKYSRDKALCCGEGGGALFIAPRYKEGWLKKRGADVSADTIAYCAGCVNNLGTVAPTGHLLDLLLTGDTHSARHSVFGYIKRMLLRLWIRRNATGEEAL